MKEEQTAIVKLHQQRGGGIPRIFPTALLVYRLFRAAAADPAVAAQIHRLQSQVPSEHASALPTGGNDDDASAHHAQAVMATVVTLIQVSSSMTMPSPGELQHMIHRVKMNGFSIADGESIALGIGVYATPSFMNHSCRPNVVQTFLYARNAAPPTLFLTAYDDITAGEEIVISYLDNSSPRHIRRARLEKDYLFVCDCPACQQEKTKPPIRPGDQPCPSPRAIATCGAAARCPRKWHDSAWTALASNPSPSPMVGFAMSTSPMATDCSPSRTRAASG